MNEKLEILLQKRSSNKKVYPNLWSLFVKGHVQANEDSLIACMRELKEELGISIKKEELIYLYTIKEEKINQDYIEKIFYDTYVLTKNINLIDLKIEKKEISEVKYMYYQDVFKLISETNNNFVPNYEDYKRILKYLK